jgi:hypothetical protein
MSYCKKDIIFLLQKRIELINNLKQTKENYLIHYNERCLLENEQYLRNHQHPLLKNLFLCLCDYNFNQQHVDKINNILKVINK